MKTYGEIAFGAGSRRRQRERGSYDRYRALAGQPGPVELGAREVDFLRSRDSFYLASVGDVGWPYVQHRGGAPGFITATGPAAIAWAERGGNRQYVSAGNLDADDRVAIIAVDYPNRQRLKLYGHARYLSVPPDGLTEAFASSGDYEAIVTVDVVAFDWNCPKFITPRLTLEEVQEVVGPLRERIAELERGSR